MSAAGFAVRSRRQALTAILPVCPGKETGLEAELRLRQNQWLAGLKTSTTLHFAKLALLPGEAGGARLMVETSFEGPLETHLRELWNVSGPAWADILRHCVGHSQGLDCPGFCALIDHHVVRVTAACSAHAGLTRAVIENDARIDQVAQSFLDQEQAARILTGHDPLEIVDRLREELTRHSDIWVGSLELDVAEPVRTDGLFRRFSRPVAALGLRLMDRLARSNRVRRRGGSTAGINSQRPGEICLQSPFLSLSPRRRGRFRRWALSTLLRGLGERLPALDQDPGELSRLHAGRWVLLEDGRLLVSLTHDGSPASFRAFAPRSLTRYLALYAEAFELRTQIWYSAYPELSVNDVLRNHRLRELFARPSNRDSARALAALL
jgi:hypothetical protein